MRVAAMMPAIADSPVKEEAFRYRDPAMLCAP